MDAAAALAKNGTSPAPTRAGRVNQMTQTEKEAAAFRWIVEKGKYGITRHQLAIITLDLCPAPDHLGQLLAAIMKEVQEVEG